MKRKAVPFYLLIIAISFFSFVSCPHSGEDGDKGSITINFGGETARWAGSSYPSNIPPLHTLGYKIELLSLPAGTQAGTATINPGGGSHTFNNITPGDYGVKVVASSNGYNFAYGEDLSVTVAAGVTATPLIPLQRLPIGGIVGGIVLDQNGPYTSAAPSGYNPVPLTLTATNYGVSGTGSFIVSLSNSNFVIVSPSPATGNLSQDDTRSFQIEPTAGLTVATYNADLTITSAVTGLELSPALALRFTVGPAWTVTFNANGGTGTENPISVAQGSVTVITIPAGSGLTAPTGFTFGGWYSNVGGTITHYSAGASYTPTANVTMYAIWQLSSLVMENIPAGIFTMGSPTTEPGHLANETPQHSVTLSAFKMGKYEVTQGQYAAVTGSSPSFHSGANLPVEQVSWYDTLVFCNKLSMMEGLSPVYEIGGSTDPAVWGAVPTSSSPSWNAVIMDTSANGYRLPTEAEWEYACRAGSPAAFSWGTNNIDNTKANYDAAIVDSCNTTAGTSVGATTMVGTYAANSFNLHDMHGNVFEWCWDWFALYSAAAATDPTGPVTGTWREMRGGCWGGSAEGSRSAFRDDYSNPWFNFNSIGFRVVR